MYRSVTKIARRVVEAIETVPLFRRTKIHPDISLFIPPKGTGGTIGAARIEIIRVCKTVSSISRELQRLCSRGSFYDSLKERKLGHSIYFRLKIQSDTRILSISTKNFVEWIVPPRNSDRGR